MCVLQKSMPALFMLEMELRSMCVCVLQKSVFALCMLEDGTLLSGGGSEIKAWDSMNSYRAVKERTVSILLYLLHPVKDTGLVLKLPCGDK